MVKGNKMPQYHVANQVNIEGEFYRLSITSVPLINMLGIIPAYRQSNSR